MFLKNSRIGTSRPNCRMSSKLTHGIIVWTLLSSLQITAPLVTYARIQHHSALFWSLDQSLDIQPLLLRPQLFRRE
jgi:hypothetical protein